MDNPAVIGPALGAAIAGASLLLSNRLITYWTARQKRLADTQANRDAAAVAKITTDEQDRERVSASMWALIKDLRGEIGDLRAALDKRETQVDKLIEDMGQLRAIERRLRDENAQLRQETETLRDRVATLEGQLGGVTLSPPILPQP